MKALWEWLFRKMFQHFIFAKSRSASIPEEAFLTRLSQGSRCEVADLLGEWTLSGALMR